MKKILIRKNLAVILAVIFICFVLIFSWVKEIYRDSMIENSKESFAFFVKSTDGTVGHGPRAIFEFSLNGVTYQFEEQGNFSHLKKGDVVQIKYSIKDPNVATVTNDSKVWK